MRPIDDDIERAVDYALKNIKRGRFAMDDVLVLPRAGAEVRLSLARV